MSRIVRAVAWGLFGAALLAVTLRQLGVAPAYTPLTGVTMALLALALVGLAGEGTDRGRLPALAGLAVSLLALLTVFRPSLVPEGWATGWAPALVLLTGSVTLVWSAFSRRLGEQVMLGVGGFVLTMLGLVALVVRLTASADELTARGFETFLPGLAVGTVVLGLATLALAWTRVPHAAPIPRWGPLAAAVGGIAASLLLWRTLVDRERAEQQRLLEAAATSRARSIEREVISIGQVLLTFATFHRPHDPDSATALTLLRRDLATADVVALVDSAGQPTLAIPRGRDLSPIARTVPPRAIPRAGSPPPSVAVLEIPGDTSRVVIHAALCSAGACPGGVAAIVDPSLLSVLITGGRRLDWRFSISPPHAYQPRDAQQFTLPVKLGDLTWTITASRSTGPLAPRDSSLPEVVFVLGLISTALLSTTIRVAGRAWESARVVERMRVAAAIATATDSIWEWDLVTGSLRRSGELWRHLGRDPATVTQTLEAWLAMIHPEDRSAAAMAFGFVTEGYQSDLDLEYRVADDAGRWHTIVDRGRVIDRHGNGRPARVMGITADVTASRLAERQLREVEALSGIGRIAARTAHEINNPLAGIRSAFLLIKDAVPPEHPHFRYVGAIEREIERIATVTRHLYETYRPEPDSAGASLQTVASDAASLLGELNREHRVAIAVMLDDVPGVLPVSGALLRQIVYNLVQNAVDASPRGATVDLLGRMEGHELVIEVRDRGPGIPVELRERIFEPFFTTKASGIRTSGLGLGLAMVERSVAAAGGTILVDDTPGGGATFTVRLPITMNGSSA